MRSDSSSQFYENQNDEPIGESFISPSGWLIALAAVAVMATMQGLDFPDHSSEWKRSSALEQQQDDEQRAERRALAAQALCTSEHGPQALAVWTDDHTIECVSTRGKRLSRMEAGDALR
jgi:hypothetical protein